LPIYAAGFRFGILKNVKALAPAEWLDRRLSRLLKATLIVENAVSQRDLEIAVIQAKYGPSIQKSNLEISSLTAEIEAYYRANREELEPSGEKSLQLAYGLVGMRAPSHPALVPLNAKWDWDRIAGKVKELWGKKYFHKPKPPGIDKNKIKKELEADELAQAGLKLDDEEKFYLELNRLAPADQIEEATAA
jgi:Bacteriophage Mu Gam like protein